MCDIDLQMYPFDPQMCYINLTAFAIIPSMIKVTKAEAFVSNVNFKSYVLQYGEIFQSLNDIKIYNITRGVTKCLKKKISLV